MHNSINTDTPLIEKCKKLIEEKINLGESRFWKQRDYEYLSELIFDASNVLLSVSTLKRLWKKEKESLPHSSTLNALAVFAGYKDWTDFKKSCSEITTADTSGDEKKKEKSSIFPVFLNKINRLFVRGKAQPAVSIIVILIIAMYVILKSSTEKPSSDGTNFLSTSILSNLVFSLNENVEETA